MHRTCSIITEYGFRDFCSMVAVLLIFPCTPTPNKSQGIFMIRHGIASIAHFSMRCITVQTRSPRHSLGIRPEEQ